jgi:uncharacterized protein involved in outer membrane biogenesis
MAKRFRALRWALIVVAALAAIALAVPFLVPVSGYIPEIARIASEKLGQPVAIEALRLQLLPTPRGVASGIRIGKRNDATIGELEIVPDLLSFLSGPRTLRLVRAEKVELKESALAIAGSMPKGEKGEAMRVRRVVLKQVKLHHSALKLPEFDLEADLGDAYRLERALVETRDGALKLRVEPQGGGLSNVALEARKWTLPAGAPLLFDSLAAQGTLKEQTLELPRIDGRLYGGTLAGSARAGWAKHWQLAGKASLAGVDLAPVQQALGKKPRLTGRLKAEATFGAKARSAEQLANALALDAPFEVVGGAWQGIDLTRVTELPLGKLTPGGATKFEQLTGKLAMRGRRVRVNDLCARSSLLVAGGYVEIAPDQKLSGKLDVSVAKTGGFVGVPVALAGTTADPSVTLTKGAAIGAVIGTVLLPGIGTALGASAGSRIEGRSDCK